MLRGRLEAYRQLASLERVLAENFHLPVLDLDEVVAGAGIAPEAEGRGGAGVDDDHVFQFPGVGHVFVAREDEVYAHVYEPLQDVARVKDDVPFAPRPGEGDEVVVDDEDLQFVPGFGEGFGDELVVLPAHLPVVLVGLRGILPDQNDVVEIQDRSKCM